MDKTKLRSKGRQPSVEVLSQARVLIRDYRKQCGFSAVVTEGGGRILAGTLDCGGCSKAGCESLRRRIVDESLRWGAPFMDLCPRGWMLWGVPLMVNQRVVGGGIASSRGKGVKAMASIRKAADALLAMAEKFNVTNASLLATNRARAERERQRAEAIHDAKGTDYDHIRAVYLQEEPALIAAIRNGERGVARDIINRVLVGIYFLGRERLDLLKSLVLELVVMMSRAAVEAGASPAEILGGHYRGLNELAVIRDDEALTHWLADMLERVMDAIHDNRRYPNTVLLGRALHYMQEHLMEDLTRDQTARMVGLSPSHFSHLVRAQLNSSFTDLLVRYRVDHAARLLTRTTSSIAEVALACGFPDQSYFTKVFKKQTGQTPLAYRHRTKE
jgi:AraC-like DNA-binding protein